MLVIDCPPRLAWRAGCAVVTMPRRNRVDPFGDLHAVSARGLFTGNRGCVVDDHERVVRHHANTSLWIVCRTEFRGWRWPLARPRRWTPLFFLDDAVALAAGHRPCATCRRADYRGYRDAVTGAVGASTPLSATDLNGRLQRERLRAGRGIARRGDRIVWSAEADTLPDGAVIVGDDGMARLVIGDRTMEFDFDGWRGPEPRPSGLVTVLTPPTSVAALAHGFQPTLHSSSQEA
jgi:hypothetical protein